MIQRIQTIWLLVATILGIVSLKTSFYSGHRINDSLPKSVVFITGSTHLLLILCATGIAFASFIGIFLFKHRKLQLKICIAASILSIINLALYYWQTQRFIAAESSYTLTALIPLAIPFILMIAARGIWKDEQLVRSVDRLR